MDTREVVPTRRRKLADTSRSWRGCLSLFLLPLLGPGVAEADLSQTGRWWGPYLIGSPLPIPITATSPPCLGPTWQC